MNDEQVNEYMQALLSGKRKVEGLLEGVALNHFREATTQIAHGRQRAAQLTAEAEQIRNGVQQLIGQQSAYSQLLVAAETARRSEAGGDREPLSLAEFRDKMGADRVEAVDNEGNTVDSSELGYGVIREEDKDEKPAPEEETEPCQK